MDRNAKLILDDGTEIEVVGMPEVVVNEGECQCCAEPPGPVEFTVTFDIEPDVADRLCAFLLSRMERHEMMIRELFPVILVSRAQI